MEAQPIIKYRKVPMNKSGTSLNVGENEDEFIMSFEFLGHKFLIFQVFFGACFFRIFFQLFVYSGCQKNVPLFKRFFLQPLIPAGMFL